MEGQDIPKEQRVGVVRGLCLLLLILQLLLPPEVQPGDVLHLPKEQNPVYSAPYGH